MKYYKKELPGGEWKEIKGTEMINAINARFDETPRKNWDGANVPSRQQVTDYIHSGGILHTYTAEYKAEAE